MKFLSFWNFVKKRPDLTRAEGLSKWHSPCEWIDLMSARCGDCSGGGVMIVVVDSIRGGGGGVQVEKMSLNNSGSSLVNTTFSGFRGHV